MKPRVFLTRRVETEGFKIDFFIFGPILPTDRQFRFILIRSEVDIGDLCDRKCILIIPALVLFSEARQNILPPREPKCRMKIEIAAELGLSTRTVEDRRAKLMKKMGAKSLAELVQLAMTH